MAERQKYGIDTAKIRRRYRMEENETIIFGERKMADIFFEGFLSVKRGVAEKGKTGMTL